MKSLIALFLLGFSTMAWANAQIDLSNGTCHFPLENVDTDNELKATCSAYHEEESGEGGIAGSGHAEVSNVPIFNVPGTWEIANGDEGCTLINDDGQASTVSNWRVAIKSICGAQRRFDEYMREDVAEAIGRGRWYRPCELIMDIVCWD